MTVNDTEELSYKPIGKLLLQYSTPCIIGTILSILYNLIDRIFVGQACGFNAIAGLAVTTPIISLYSIIGRFIATGAATQISISLGQKDEKTVEKIIGNSYILLLILQIMFIIPLIIYIKPILFLFGCSDNTIIYAQEYIYYLIPCMLLENFCSTTEEIMRSIGYTQKATIILLIGVVINLILCPILTFKFNLGIKGTAIATDVAIIVSFICLLQHFLNKKNKFHLKKNFFTIKNQIVYKIYTVGISAMIIYLASITVNLLINLSLKINGGTDRDIAAAGIINSLWYVINMFNYGLCQGMKPIIGYNYGAKLIKRMYQAYWVTVKTAIICGLVTYAIIAIFPNYIISLFSKDPIIIKITSIGIRIALLFTPFMGLCMATINFLQATEMPKFAVLLSICRQIVFLTPLLFLLPKFFGLIGVWIAVPIADSLAVITAIILIYSKINIAFNSNKQPVKIT